MIEENAGLLDATTTMLSTKPWIGAAVSSGSGAVSIMGILTPYLEFTTLVVGFFIGLLTLIGLIKRQLINKK